MNNARIKFFSIEHSVNKGSSDDPSNDRYRLINNHGEIVKQGSQITDIKRKGIEAADVMKEANRDLNQ